jgi:hypothetical protein
MSRSTRACSPHFICVWKPTRLKWSPASVVLPQLHDRVGLAAGARIAQAHGLHRSEPQRLPPAGRHHLDRQAPLEELRVVEVVQRCPLGRDERVVEARVLVGRQRAVQVVSLAIVHAAGRCPLHAAVGSRPRLRPQREARNTFVRSMLSASTIGLMAS